MGYPVSYRAARPEGVPNTAAPKRALKVPGRFKPANDNIPRVPPKPANDNIPRIPPKPANDNFKYNPPKNLARYGWIRGAGIIGNLGGFQGGSALDVAFYLNSLRPGQNALHRWVQAEHVSFTGGWYLDYTCQSAPVYASRCALSASSLCNSNLFFNGTTACTSGSTSWQTLTNPGGPAGSSFQWRIVQQYRRPVNAGEPLPVFVPQRVNSLPEWIPTPGVMKWADPMSWPVTANDPGPLRIPQSAIRARRPNNPMRIPAESFVRGYEAPRPGGQQEEVPSLINGKGQIEVDFAPDGSNRPVIKPNTHRSARPPKGVKESKKRITRAAAIVLGIVNETTEAIDMFDCLFRAIPYKRRKAYAAWRAQTQRAAIKKKWPSITDDYIDYLVRRVRRNSGQRRDIYKARDAEGKPVHQLMPLALRDDLPANIGPELRDALVKLEKVTVGSKEAGFSIAERFMLIEKHFDEIDWLSKDDQPIDWRQMPSVDSIDGVKGALACMMAQGIDDLLTALPGMTTQQAYHWALDKAGIDPDMITGLEFGPAYNP